MTASCAAFVLHALISVSAAEKISNSCCPDSKSLFLIYVIFVCAVRGIIVPHSIRVDFLLEGRARLVLLHIACSGVEVVVSPLVDAFFVLLFVR